MVKLMWFRGIVNRGGYADWRWEDGGPLDGAIGDWDAGQEYDVEDFKHWVWIYDVDEKDNNEDNIPDTSDSLGQTYSIVRFTYTHPTNRNLFKVENSVWWPTAYYLDGRRLRIHVPWFSGYEKQNNKYISTTELIWYWHAFDYDSTGESRPTAVTRYYDTSP